MINELSHQVELGDFIKKTLEEVSRAVEGKHIGNACIPVHFDLGIVTASSCSSKTKGGLQLNVASVLKAGTLGNSNKQEGSVEYNRISLTVPLLLDPQKVNIDAGANVC